MSFHKGVCNSDTVEERTTGNGTEKKIMGVPLPHIKKEIVDVPVKSAARHEGIRQ